MASAARPCIFRMPPRLLYATLSRCACCCAVTWWVYHANCDAKLELLHNISFFLNCRKMTDASAFRLVLERSGPGTMMYAQLQQQGERGSRADLLAAAVRASSLRTPELQLDAHHVAADSLVRPAGLAKSITLQQAERSGS